MKCEIFLIFQKDRCILSLLKNRYMNLKTFFFFFWAVTSEGAKFSPESQQGLISSSAPLKTPLCEVWCNTKSEMHVSVPQKLVILWLAQACSMAIWNKVEVWISPPPPPRIIRNSQLPFLFHFFPFCCEGAPMALGGSALRPETLAAPRPPVGASGLWQEPWTPAFAVPPLGDSAAPA